MRPDKSIASRAFQIEVSRSGVGQRLDNYLLRILKSVPRSHVYRVIRQGQVRVNGSRCRVHRKLVAGDLIRLPPIRSAVTKPMLIPADFEILRERVLYEDDSLLVIDKPPGIAAHGGSGLRGGVIEALRSYRQPNEYLELVHRLDRETSGCLMLAKDPEILRVLHSYLRSATSVGIQKKYLSLLVGNWVNGPRDIDLSLETVRTTNRSRRSVVKDKGRRAYSRFVPVQHFKQHVLVEIELITGRMHQIRAHAAAIGYPVAGDRKYGPPDGRYRLSSLGLNRLFLHAAEIELKHPQTGQRVTIRAAIPEDLKKVLTGLE